MLCKMQNHFFRLKYKNRSKKWSPINGGGGFTPQPPPKKNRVFHEGGILGYPN